MKSTYPNLKLMIMDDQRSHLSEWAEIVMADAKASEFVDGIGFHWYAAVEDLFPYFDRLEKTHHKFPNLFLLGTEACEGYLPW